MNNLVRGTLLTLLFSILVEPLSAQQAPRADTSATKCVEPGRIWGCNVQERTITVTKTVSVPTADPEAVAAAREDERKNILDSLKVASAKGEQPKTVATAGPRRVVTGFGRKECTLGTALAINKNRQVKPGEVEFTTTEPYDVRINEHESEKSTHAIWVDCTLPAGTAVVCSAGGCWVKVCGNDVMGVPFEALPGKPGRDGRDGRDGTDGRDGSNGTDGANGTDGRNGENGRGFHLGKKSAIIGGVLGTAVIVCAIICPRAEAESNSNSTAVVTIH